MGKKVDGDAGGRRRRQFWGETTGRAKEKQEFDVGRVIEV